MFVMSGDGIQMRVVKLKMEVNGMLGTRRLRCVCVLKSYMENRDALGRGGAARGGGGCGSVVKGGV